MKQISVRAFYLRINTRFKQFCLMMAVCNSTVDNCHFFRTLFLSVWVKWKTAGILNEKINVSGYSDTNFFNKHVIFYRVLRKVC